MKICSYKISTTIGDITRFGILKGDQVLDPNLTWKNYFESRGFYNSEERANNHCPFLLSQFLKLKESPIPFLNETLELVDKGFGFTLTSKDISLTKPLDKIEVYRDFYAHEKHVKKGFEKRKEEVPAAWYEIPAYYKGATAGFIGPEEEVLWPSYTNILDYELELAVVIGKDGKNISEKNALNHVFGFTILNDISARDIQKKEMSVRLGPAKGKDFCSIIGPVITTIDEFNNSEPNLEMIAWVNGDEWSRGQSGDAHYSFSQMIEHASKDEWLLSTDLLGSGTVGTGCGLEIDKWLKPGDVIELEVESIGTLRNTIGQKKG